MLTHVTAANMARHATAIDGMFRHRKRVFVDLLRWDVPVIGPWESDQFDDEDAEYLIITDADTGQHHGSLRLLRTDRPHILDSLFPQLCAAGAPSGPHIREITRLVMSPSLKAAQRRIVRNKLFTAAVEHALDHHIQAFTGVVEMPLFGQLVGMGWRTAPLGLPCEANGDIVAAIIAHVEPDTLLRFREAGTYHDIQTQPAPAFAS